MTEEVNTAQPEAVQPEDNENRTAGENDAPVGLTQAQLNALIANEKKQVRLKVLQEIGDVEGLKAKAAKFDELESAQLSENEKLKKQLADMQAQITAKEQEAAVAALNTLRLRVGTELGLPPNLSELLRGDDADAMKEHAKSIIDAMKVTVDSSVTIPNIDATQGGEQRKHSKQADIPPAIKKLIAKGMITEEAYLTAQKTMEG